SVWEDRLEGLVCEHDAIARVHRQHCLLQVAQGGLQLGEASAALELELAKLGCQVVRGAAKVIPGRAQRSRKVLAQERLPAQERKLECPERPFVSQQAQEK